MSGPPMTAKDRAALRKSVRRGAIDAVRESLLEGFRVMDAWCDGDGAGWWGPEVIEERERAWKELLQAVKAQGWKVK